jgi:hypothetical protein
MNQLFRLDDQQFAQQASDWLAKADDRLQSLTATKNLVAGWIDHLLQVFLGEKELEDPELLDNVDGFFKALLPAEYPGSNVGALIQLLRMGYRIGQLHHLLTLEEAAPLAGKTANAVYKDIKNKRVNGYFIGGQWYVDRFQVGKGKSHENP